MLWERFRALCFVFGRQAPPRAIRAGRHRRRTGVAGLIDKAGENSKRLLGEAERGRHVRMNHRRSEGSKAHKPNLGSLLGSSAMVEPE